MIELLKDQKLIEENPFETAKIKRLVSPSEFGMDSAWYGGQAKWIAELKDKDLYLVISKDMKTLDVAVKKEKIVRRKKNENIEA